MCERCGDDRCSDPDSKWCSDILMMRYKAERDALREAARELSKINAQHGQPYTEGWSARVDAAWRALDAALAAKEGK